MSEQEGQMEVKAEIVRQEITPQEVMLTPCVNLQTAVARLHSFQEFVKGYLVEATYTEGIEENGDYGIIPGTKKKTLLKPGADKLCELYGLADEYAIVPEFSREDWDRQPPLFDYTVYCTLRNKRTGRVDANGMGNCNSYEAKYKWRDQNRKCPECGKETIFRSKKRAEDGDREPGWYCWTKKGGCGGQFPADSVRITSQVTGRIENDDIATLKNTILKMAKKRAKVDATLSATRSSGIFTQDMEDIGDAVQHASQPAPAPQPKSLPQEPVKVPPPSTGEQVGIIERLAAKQHKQGTPYMVFTLNGNSVYVWDTALFDFLKENEGKRIAAVVEVKGNFANMVSGRPVKEETPAGNVESQEIPLWE